MEYSVKNYEDLDHQLLPEHYDAIIRFMSELPIAPGREFIVLDWHRRVLRDILNPNISSVNCTLPRKLGKSSYLGVLIVWCLLNLRNFNIGVVSLGMKQTLVLRDIIESITIENEIDGGFGGIRHYQGNILYSINKQLNSKVTFLSSGKSSGHSSIFALSICDETGVYDENRIDVLNQMADATASSPGGCTVNISVLGTNSYFQDQKEAALTSDHTSWLEYSAPYDADPSSEEVWEACNPGLDVVKSRAWMRGAYERARVSTERLRHFRIYQLNQSLSPEASVMIDRSEWEQCVVSEEDLPELGPEITLSFDLGDSHSASACVAYDPYSGRVDYLLAFCSKPSIEDRSRAAGLGDLLRKAYEAGDFILLGEHAIDNDAFLEMAAQMVGDRRVLSCGIDSWRKNHLIDMIHRKGYDWPISGRSLGYRQSSLDLEAFEYEVREQRIKVRKSLALDISIGQTKVTADSQGFTRIGKQKGVKSSNDAAIALMLAVALGREARETTEEFKLPPLVMAT